MARLGLYEALEAPDGLTRVAHRLAGVFGAQSAVLNFTRADGGVAHGDNGYYPADAHARYDDAFEKDDLWLRHGSRPTFLNRPWRASDHVPRTTYLNSRIYNEWTRAIGDDCSWCVGVVLKTPDGAGCIGLHRSGRAGDFARDAAARLAAMLPDLRAVLGQIARQAALARPTVRPAPAGHEPALGHCLGEAALASDPDPALVLDASARLLFANPAGEALLQAGGALRLAAGRVAPAAPVAADAGLQPALARAAGRDGTPAASRCLIADPAGGHLVATVMPFVWQGRAVILCRLPPTHHAGGEERLLAGALGLTGAEADVALRLADGQTLAEISAARRVGLATVRSQVKAVQWKTGARGQVDIVRLVAQLRAGRLPAPVE